MALITTEGGRFQELFLGSARSITSAIFNESKMPAARPRWPIRYDWTSTSMLLTFEMPWMLLLKSVLDIYREKFRTSKFKTRNVGFISGRKSKSRSFPDGL